MSYYNLCGIGSQHSNISKGKKGGGGTYSLRNKAVVRSPWRVKLYTGV